MKKLVLAVAAVAAMGAFADLPARYKQLEWIESDGTQWLLTDFVPNSTNVIECGFRIPTQGTSEAPRVFCSRGAAGYADRAYAFGFDAPKTDDGKLGRVSAFNGDWGDFINDYFLYYDEDCEIVFDTPARKLTFKLTDGTTKAYTTRGSVEFTGGSKLAIFCNHQLGAGLTKDSSVTKSIVRLYYLRIKDKDGNVLLDLVPVRDLQATVSASSVGLYDTVNGDFYGSCTGSRFIASDGQDFTLTLNHGDYASDAEAGAALVAAAKTFGEGDVLKIGKGRWLLSAETGPVVLGTRAVIRGETDDPRDTVIDADGVTRGLYIVNANYVTVSSLTVTNGLADRTTATIRAGGGIYASDAKNLLVTNCVVTGCHGVYDGTEQTTVHWDYIDGCGLYSSGADAEIVDTLIENNCLDAVAFLSTCRYGVRGIGANLSGAGATMRRCVVRNNMHYLKTDGKADQIGHYASGVYVNGSILERCAIYGNGGTNEVAGGTYPMSTSGGGVYLSGAAGRMTGCYVARNGANNGSGLQTSGACLVEDCDFENNDGSAFQYSKGGHAAIGAGTRMVGCRFFNAKVNDSSTAIKVEGADGVVSNCLFRGLTNGKQLIGAASVCLTVAHSIFCGNTFDYVFGNAGHGLTVTDCVFSNNVQSAAFCGFANMDTTINSESQVKRVRNCLFVGNTMAGGTGRGKMAGTWPVQFVWDGCTFISNSLPSSLYRFSGDGLSKTGVAGEGPLLAPSLITRNCLFWKNYSGRNPATIINANFADSPNSVSNNFIYGADDAYVTTANGNIIDVEDPGFVDAANGDYRISRKGAVRDKGSLSDWMGDGSRKSPRSMGKGFDVEEDIVTFTACGETHSVGCNLTKVGAGPRLYGTAPDIGCCEYFAAPGLLLMVK